MAIESLGNLIRLLRWLLVLGVAAVAAAIFFGMVRSDLPGGAIGAFIGGGVVLISMGTRGVVLVRRQIRALESPVSE